MTYRLRYSLELCTSHYRGYTTSDLIYLCKWYGIISSREIALALGRTQDSVLNKVKRLKQNNEFDFYRSTSIKITEEKEIIHVENKISGI